MVKKHGAPYGALRQLEAERDLILALQTESAEQHMVH